MSKRKHWLSILLTATLILPTEAQAYNPKQPATITVASPQITDILFDKSQPNGWDILVKQQLVRKEAQDKQRAIDEANAKAAADALAAQEAAQAELLRQQSLTRIQAPVAATTDGNSYSYGYCTWYVKQRKPNVPNLLGDARNWGYALGYTSTPSVGAIAWTTAGYYGHVAIVIAVGNGQVEIEEMNGSAGWNRVDDAWYPTSQFNYIVGY